MSEVTVSQYQEIMAYADTNPTDRELTLKMVQVFCKIKDASIIEYADLIRISRHLANMLNDKPSLTVFWNDKGFIPNLSKITFGELIDLDNYLPQNKFLHKSMAILYRKVEARSRDLYTITPYEGAGDASEYKEMPLSIAMGAMLFFLDYRQGFSERYPSIFPAATDDDRGANLSGSAQFAARWGWYSSVFNLAGGDITKFDQITKEPASKCLTALEYMKQQDEQLMMKANAAG